LSFLLGDDEPSGAQAGAADATLRPSGFGAAVAVVDADQAVRSRLAMQLGDFAVPVSSLESLESRLTGIALVAVLGPSCAGADGIAAAEAMIGAHPEVGAVLITTELSTDTFRQALRAGIRDVLPAPVDTAQLTDSVRRIADSLVSSRPSDLGADLEGGEQGQVVTVFSTKGGAGKSVIAANLAVVLARRSTKPVVLVDADLQFGDVAVMLKLAPQHTIVDAVGSIDRLDAALLQNLLVRHEPSGLLVLPAPLEPAFADQIGAEQMVRIVELLRSFCEFVVVDTPAYFNDVVLGLIEISDDVLLVAGMDIPNIKNVKIGLQTLRLLNTPMSKLRLILNRANSKVKLDVGEVERTLQIKADSLIPSDVVVPQSVNRGVPVVLDAPKSGVAKSIEQLADLFLTADAKRKKR
jgi:pilus assembly protein CpaE